MHQDMLRINDNHGFIPSNELASDILTRKTLVLVLAGGEGSRLYDLTEWRAKPSVPFGGKFRIIDFPLSNCINSGIRKIGGLTQYKSQSLIEYVRENWGLSALIRDHFVTVVPPQMRYGKDWFQV